MPYIDAQGEPELVMHPDIKHGSTRLRIVQRPVMEPVMEAMLADTERRAARHAAKLEAVAAAARRNGDQ